MVAIGTGQLGIIQHIPDRLVALVDQDHHTLTGLGVQAIEEIAQQTTRQVPGHARARHSPTVR